MGAQGQIATSRQAGTSTEKPTLTGAVSYTGNRDLMDDDSGKMGHRLGVSLEFQKFSPWVLSLGTGVYYYSIENDIPTESGNPSIEDTDLTLGYSRQISARNTWNLGLTATLPTSEESKFEQYVGLAGLSNSLNTKINSWLDLTNELDLVYIANTLEYSPTTNQKNVSTFASYALGVRVALTKALKFSLRTGLKISNYIHSDPEDSTLSTATWSAGLGYTFRSFTVGLSYKNGSYDDQEPLRYFALDQYRQKVGLAVTYVF